VGGTVDKTTVATELGKTETLMLTVTGTMGFSGTVNIVPTVVDAAGNPVTGWTLTPTPASVDLSTDGSAQVSLTVAIPTDTAALASTVKVGLTSTAAAVAVTSAFTVANQYTFNLEAVGTGAHTLWPARASDVQIHAGAAIIFHNADTIPHEIHGDNGVQHEGGALAAGADYKTVPTATAGGPGSWYCHLHGIDSANARTVTVIP
jgi:plastocyanin